MTTIADDIKQLRKVAKITHLVEGDTTFTDLVLRILDHVEELESAQRPRPMDEAPKDGTELWGIVPLKWCEANSLDLGVDIWVSRDGCGWDEDPDEDGTEKRFIGWLPLPDKDDDTP